MCVDMKLDYSSYAREIHFPEPTYIAQGFLEYVYGVGISEF